MKRLFLLTITNIAVMIVLSVIVNILGLNQYLTANGLNLPMLLALSAVIGFGGALINLAMSKFMSRRLTGAQVITEPRNETERWLVEAVHRLADKARIEHPEVAIYEGAPNAFATGPSRRNSMVAVSTGLLELMNRQQAEAVLAHEVAHIANGDMVTLTLVQGVVNTFVYFLATIVGYVVDTALRSRNDNGGGVGAGFYIAQMVAQIVLGFLASMIVAWVSRQREFRADAGSAALNGAKPMIGALEMLGKTHPGALPQTMAAFGIAPPRSIMGLFSSHPSSEERIAALQKL